MGFTSQGPAAPAPLEPGQLARVIIGVDLGAEIVTLHPDAGPMIANALRGIADMVEAGRYDGYTGGGEPQ